MDVHLSISISAGDDSPPVETLYRTQLICVPYDRYVIQYGTPISGLANQLIRRALQEYEEALNKYLEEHANEPK